MIPDTDTLIAAHRGQCICEPCPAYNECMRADDALLFCVTGKSQNCTFDKKGCICPACPLKKVLGLTRSYYCIRGSEPEQKMP